MKPGDIAEIIGFADEEEVAGAAEDDDDDDEEDDDDDDDDDEEVAPVRGDQSKTETPVLELD